jgi:hypothetical protein
MVNREEQTPPLPALTAARGILVVSKMSSPRLPDPVGPNPIENRALEPSNCIASVSSDGAPPCAPEHHRWSPASAETRPPRNGRS